MHSPILTLHTFMAGHACVPENDVSITMDTEELVGEAAEMMDMAADSKITVLHNFSSRAEYCVVS